MELESNKLLRKTGESITITISLGWVSITEDKKLNQDQIKTITKDLPNTVEPLWMLQNFLRQFCFINIFKRMEGLRGPKNIVEDEIYRYNTRIFVPVIITS